MCGWPHACASLVLLGGRLDILALGDDTARSLGVNIGRTRVSALVLAVLLAAAAVAVAGPIGFVGLCAPAIVRLAASRSPNLLRHRWLVVLSAMAGVIVVLGSDIVVDRPRELRRRGGHGRGGQAAARGHDAAHR